MMYVYTDGACSNNGKPSAIASIGIYFGPNDSRNVARRITGKQTNNVAELTAIIEVYSILKTDILSGKQITICSDSRYAIKCCSDYGEKCSADWDTLDIPNKDLVRHAYELYGQLDNIKFMYIKAHTGKGDIHSLGNAEADKLATSVFPRFVIPNRIYLNVSYDQKDIAKQLECKWDVNKKKWYIYDDNTKKELIINMFK
jgi:ribonuclease HI